MTSVTKTKLQLYPNHPDKAAETGRLLSIDGLACDPFLQCQPRMLKLDNEPQRSHDVSDMPLTGGVASNDFLAFGGKRILPPTMPFGLYSLSRTRTPPFRDGPNAILVDFHIWLGPLSDNQDSLRPVRGWPLAAGLPTLHTA